MATEIRRFESAAELWVAAGAFLMRNEAHHNLLLGLMGRLERRPGFYETRPYFAAAFRGAEVVAAAVMTPPFPLVLSLCDGDETFEPLAAM